MMKKALRSSIYFIFVFLLWSPLFSATWSGGGADNNASSQDNWADNIVPPYGAGIIFDNSSSKECSWDLNQSYTALLLDSGYSGAVTVDSLLSLMPGIAQPNDTLIPALMGCSGGNPTGLAPLFACQCQNSALCNIGAPCTNPASCDPGVNSTCETTIWHSYNDSSCIPSNLSGLDPRNAASVTPDNFTLATSQITVKLLQNDISSSSFGWYNITGTKPNNSELHQVFGTGQSVGSQSVIALQSDPSYLGGRIGFYLSTSQGTVYFSDRAYDADWAGSRSFIHLLIYKSIIYPKTYYFAWNAGSNSQFTDMVIKVSGIDY
jgi:hypothetical protein